MNDANTPAIIERFTNPDGGDVLPGYDSVDHREWFADMDEPVEVIRTVYRYDRQERVVFYPSYELCPACDGEGTADASCPICDGHGGHPFAGQMEVQGDTDLEECICRHPSNDQER